MLKSKVENIIFGNHFLGIEVFSENNSEKGNYILVEKKKDTLTIFDNSSFANITDISLENHTDLPAVLSIYSDKVLIKETELVEKNDLILVKKTFTNLNLEDFYFDIWRLENKSIISIARKSYVDEMIKLFWETHQIKIVSVTIGISSIKHLVSFLSEETILLNSKMFNKQNKTISSNEEKTSIIYPINGINIKSDNLISFSSIINFISKSKNGSSIDELNTNLNDTFFQNTFYRKYIKFFIFFILGVLLVNFLFFNHYYNKFNEISILNTTEVENKEKIENLKRVIIEKEKSVNELSISNTQRISYLLNEIGKSVPNTIILNELQYQPILKKGNTETLTKYSDKRILVNGISNNNIQFTNWVEKLSEFNTINEVVILKFEKEDNTTSFKINILIK